jgi:electron transfer flavoprotein beta subunit
MHIVVMVKAVPNTAGDERLDERFRLDRVGVDPIINQNDEHPLEVALRLAETIPGVETTMLTMGRAGSWSGLNKGIAAGINKSVVISDDALEGSCALATANVLAAGLRKLPFDLILGGLDTSDGRAGIVASTVASLLGLPFISRASELSIQDGTVIVKRLRDDGYELLQAPLPALVTVTQTVGDLRYPSLRGIMAARSRSPETWSLGEIGLAAEGVGTAAATTSVVAVDPPSPRPPTRVVSGDPASAVKEIVEFLAERRFIS